MKVQENVTVYKCDFCKKKLLRKHAMIKHEEHCGHNPKNHSACQGCIFLKQKSETFEGYGHDYGNEYYVKTFFCEKLNKGVYPHKVVKKGLLQKYPETFVDQIKMPTKCEHWRYTEF